MIGASFMLLASKRSKQDIIRGNTIENRDICLLIMCGGTYVICTLTLTFLYLIGS